MENPRRYTCTGYSRAQGMSAPTVHIYPDWTMSDGNGNWVDVSVFMSPEAAEKLLADLPAAIAKARGL